MTEEHLVLSNFGVEYFTLPYTDSNTIPADVDIRDALQSVLSCEVGQITKENKKYKTLSGGGWDSIVTLGNTLGDISVESIRDGTGGVYDGTKGTNTYTEMKHWFLTATDKAGAASPKCFLEVKPRGEDSYEGTLYYVVPAEWGPGTVDTESGQEYGFTLTPFGPPVALTVTKTEGDGSTTFAKFTFTKAVGV